MALAEDDDRKALVVECKLVGPRAGTAAARAALAAKAAKAACCPELAGKEVVPVIAALRGPADIGPGDVVGSWA